MLTDLGGQYVGFDILNEECLQEYLATYKTFCERSTEGNEGIKPIVPYNWVCKSLGLEYMIPCSRLTYSLYDLVSNLGVKWSKAFMESTSEDELMRLINIKVVNKNGEVNGRRFDDCPIMKRAIVLFKVARWIFSCTTHYKKHEHIGWTWNKSMEELLNMKRIFLMSV